MEIVLCYINTVIRIIQDSYSNFHPLFQLYKFAKRIIASIALDSFSRLRWHYQAPTAFPVPFTLYGTLSSEPEWPMKLEKLESDTTGQILFLF